MKRIAQVLVASLLALGAQAAWSEQVPESPLRSNSVTSTMEALGITGNGPFPSRGGPIDN